MKETFKIPIVLAGIKMAIVLPFHFRETATAAANNRVKLCLKEYESARKQWLTVTDNTPKEIRDKAFDRSMTALENLLDARDQMRVFDSSIHPQ